jgi:CheY-like chemotaxis protein
MKDERVTDYESASFSSFILHPSSLLFIVSDKSEQKQSRVLVADDDPAILRLVTTLVEKEGYTVVTARDGREAIKLLKSDADFAAVIFDVVMPHIEGPELVRYMRSEKRLMKIPVIMMTAEQNPKLPSDSFAAGAGVFLPKPFTSSQLQIMLRMIINQATRHKD